MKEHFRYEQQLAPKTWNQALSIGTAIHKGLETGSVDEALKTMEGFQPNNQDEQNRFEEACATVRAALEGYWEHFTPFDHIQKEIGFEFPMIRNDGKTSRKYHLAGKIDGIANINGEDWIVEYKTASQIGSQYISRLAVDGQITLYMYAAKRLGYNPVGVIYRVIRKPQLRKKAGESSLNYTQRLVADYKDRPDFYFVEERLYRTERDLFDFETDLWNQVSEYSRQRKYGIHIPHTCNCTMFGTCEYFPICSKQAGWEELYEHRQAHEELEGK